MEPGWHCPYCGLETDTSAVKIQRAVAALDPDSTMGARALVLEMCACPNTYCGEVQASVRMHRVAGGKVQAGEPSLRSWPLIPSFEGRGMPDYVPDAVRSEYDQACATRAGSPMASATLARRCLAAMIQDFWGVREKFLSASIDALREKIDEETYEAIDSVRQEGRLAKHMEKGTNLVQEATSEEAELLIGLIEYLVDEWYITRHKRKQRLQRIKELPPRMSQAPRPAASLAPEPPSATQSRPGPGTRAAGPPPPPASGSRVPRPPRES